LFRTRNTDFVAFFKLRSIFQKRKYSVNRNTSVL